MTPIRANIVGPPDCAAAIGEAAGAIPLLRERVREDQVLDTHFILALNNRYEARSAADWWEDFARMDRAEFERNARELTELVSILRTMVTKPVRRSGGLRFIPRRRKHYSRRSRPGVKRLAP